MKTAFRSVTTVHRAALTGTALILALSAVLLTATGSWLEAGLRNPDLLGLTTITGSFAGTVVLITVFIVASIFAAVLRQRQQEFALLRAIGATTTQVRTTITTEALAVLLIATPVGAIGGLVLAPLLTPFLRTGGIVPDGFTLPLSTFAVLATVLVLVPTGLIAARMAARGMLRISPTAAVRESTSDARNISRGRLLTAGGIGAAGILAAGTPFVAPGAIGAATGATSAILLIIAAALAGPALIRWIAIRGMEATGSSSGPARVLAIANARGFSRRLSAAIIPLALLLALGSVQAGVNTAIRDATLNELHAGVTADLVVTSPAGISTKQATSITALPGVTATSATGQVQASVRTDPPDEDMPAMDALDWDAATILTLTPGTSLVDPHVQKGSLQDLAKTGTIAVSRDALLFTGKGLGDTIDVRLPGQQATVLKIAAIYNRGLGFGDYITTPRTLTPVTQDAKADAVFVSAGPASRESTRTAISHMGLHVSDKDGYVATATLSVGGEQDLSLILLFALLGFMGAAAANTLVTATSSRRQEFALLTHLGATRTQIMRMVALETGFIITTAVTIGLLAVLPALISAGQGLLGIPLPVIDLPITGGLAIVVVGISIGAVMTAAWRATSKTTTHR